MVAVIWTNKAMGDLEDIHSYISLNSKMQARRYISKIKQRVEQLKNFPKSGRVVPEFNNPLIRELIEGNYRIIYEIKPDAVWIATIFHGARHLK